MKTLSALLAVLLLAAAPAAAEWKVHSVTGTLTAGKVRLKAGSRLKPGAKLALSNGGEAILDLGEEGRLLLKGPAHATLRSTGKKRGLLMKLGALLAVLPGVKGSFTVETPAAVASVRGTDFYVQALGPRESYVCACDGLLEVHAPGGSPRALGGMPHVGQRFRDASTGRLQTEDKSMAGHSDEDLERLRALVR